MAQGRDLKILYLLRNRLRRDTKPRIVRHPDTLIVLGEDFVALMPVFRDLERDLLH